MFLFFFCNKYSFKKCSKVFFYNINNRNCFSRQKANINQGHCFENDGREPLHMSLLFPTINSLLVTLTADPKLQMVENVQCVKLSVLSWKNTKEISNLL